MPPGNSGSACAGPAMVPDCAGASGGGGHWPCGPMRSAVVTVPELLLPQGCTDESEFFGKPSGLGVSVRLLRLRSAEHAPTMAASATIAAADAPTRFCRWLSNGITPIAGRVLSRFCAGSMSLINRTIMLQGPPFRNSLPPRARCHCFRSPRQHNGSPIRPLRSQTRAFQNSRVLSVVCGISHYRPCLGGNALHSSPRMHIWTTAV
jgi:hypothetical protein